MTTPNKRCSMHASSSDEINNWLMDRRYNHAIISSGPDSKPCRECGHDKVLAIGFITRLGQQRTLTRCQRCGDTVNWCGAPRSGEMGPWEAVFMIAFWVAIALAIRWHG